MAGCGGDEDVRAVANLRAPPPVADLQATPGDGRIRLNWEASGHPGLIGYHVYRSLDPGEAFVRIASVGGLEQPWYEDSGEDSDGDGAPDGLANGVRYYYQVTAVNAQGLEGHRHLASTADAVPARAPGSFHDLQISNLRVFAGPDEVLLTWDPLDSLELLGYRVWRELLNEPGEPRALGIVPANRQHFVDTTVSEGGDYAYLVAPVGRTLREGGSATCLAGDDGLYRDCRLGVEGRRLRSRDVSPLPGDRTVPLAPGHDLSIGPFTLKDQGPSGVTLTWGRPIQNTDGSFFRTETAADELIGGGYVVYRAEAARGPFEPVTILEVLGSEVSSTWTDSLGLPEHVYMVRAFDRLGTLGMESRRLSGGAHSFPDLIRHVDAFASAEAAQVLVNWSVEEQAAGGYRIYRSRRRDRGYVALADVPREQLWYLDGSGQLALGESYWYRVAPLFPDVDEVMVAGAPSQPAVATPGPSGGVFYLEAEDARIEIASGSAEAFGEVAREARYAAFSERRALRVEYTDQAVPAASTLTLRWDMEIATEGQPIQSLQAKRFEVYLRAVEDDRAPRVDSLVVAEGSIFGGNASTGKLGLSLHREQFGTPLSPTMIPLGAMVFEDRNLGTGVPVPETLALTLTFQDPPAGLIGDGRLVLDALVLVRR